MLRPGGELRSAGGGTPRLAGYAAVFNKPSITAPYIEYVRPGAFRKALKSSRFDPIALYSHNLAWVLGRRSQGTLLLEEDDIGLAFEVQLPDTTIARDLLRLVERGDVKGCSFGFFPTEKSFRIRKQGKDYVREIVEADLFEITLTALPAFPDTTVGLQKPIFQRQLAPRVGLARRFLETI